MKNPFMNQTPQQLVDKATEALGNLYLIGLAIEQLPSKDAEWVTLKVSDYQTGIENKIETEVLTNITPKGEC